MEVTLDEARDLLPNLAWTEVEWREPGSGMDQHWYVIRDREVPVDLFWAIHRLIRREGHQGLYTARYRPERPMKNWYLELEDDKGEAWDYWTIPAGAGQVCRTRTAYRQHAPLPEQQTLPEGGTDEA